MPRKHKREKVEDNLYKAGDVFYAMAVPPGERQARWETLGPVGIMQARRRRDVFVAEVRTGGHGPITRDKARLTFGDVYEEWVQTRWARVTARKLKARTVQIQVDHWNRYLEKQLGARRLSALKPDDLVRWHEQQIALGQSDWYIRQRWGVITAVLGYAARHHGIPSAADALERNERPTAGAHRVRVLSEAEIQRLVSVVRPHYYAAIATAIFTGLRRSELLGLVWDDIDFEEGVIRVRYQLLTKSLEREALKSPWSVRDVVLMPSLAGVLRRHRIASPHSLGTDLVFCSRSGKTIGHRNLQTRGLDKVLSDAGLVDITLHTLRHTFASILISQGRDPEFVRDQMGHKDAAFTLRVYTHLFNAAKQLKQARDELEAEHGHLLKGASEGTSA